MGSTDVRNHDANLRKIQVKTESNEYSLGSDEYSLRFDEYSSGLSAMPRPEISVPEINIRTVLYFSDKSQCIVAKLCHSVKYGIVDMAPSPEVNPLSSKTGFKISYAIWF